MADLRRLEIKRLINHYCTSISWSGDHGQSYDSHGNGHPTRLEEAKRLLELVRELEVR